jgi:hypothetical protein
LASYRQMEEAVLGRPSRLVGFLPPLGSPAPPGASQWPGAPTTSWRRLDASLAVAADGALRSAADGVLVMVNFVLRTALVLREWRGRVPRYRPSSSEKMVHASFAVASDVIFVGSPWKLSPDCVLASHVSLAFGSFFRPKSYTRKLPVCLGFQPPQPGNWVGSRNKKGLRLKHGVCLHQYLLISL